MKKILFVLLLGSLLIPAITLAATAKCSDYTSQNTCESKGCAWDTVKNKCLGVGDVDVFKTLNAIVNWAFAILLVMAALFIVVAAFYFVTAGGAPEKIEMARNLILYAIIGVVVALLAKGLIKLVSKMAIE